MTAIVYNGKERNISPLLMKPELVSQTILGVKTETRRLKGELWKDHTGGLPFKFPRQSFQSLWYSINGKESWAKNPWVWKISYKVIEKPV